MPSSALDTHNQHVNASAVNLESNNKRPFFYCPECGKRMVFVECERKINHFRHYKLADCEYESEPETEEHFFAKQVVEDSFESFESIYDEELFYGKEKPLIDKEICVIKYPDISLEIPKLNKKIAVEVQYTNYDIRTFQNKILYYAFRGITVIYLFFGENFQNTLKANSNIFLLKDIEKEIFYKNNLPVYAGYLYYDKNKTPYVEIPSFSAKYKKGNSDYLYGLPHDLFVQFACCKNRFIKEFNPQRLKLRDWLFEKCFNENPKIASGELCKHKTHSYMFSNQKIKRYKEVCTICKKFIRWVPNKEALALGLKQNKEC